MKKRNYLMTAAIAAALGGASFAAQAGTFPGTNTNFSTEAVTGTTDITPAAQIYTMGVDRAAAQSFVMIFTLSAGQFASAHPNLVYNGADTGIVITRKRGGVGSNEIVFEVDTSGATAGGILSGETFSLDFAGPSATIDNHGMTTAGQSVTMTVALKDPGETSFVDNPGTLTGTVATMADSSNFWNTVTAAAGVITDTGLTGTDVNAGVPLAGFIAGGLTSADDDTATTAIAQVQVRNATAGVMDPTGVTYTLVAGDIVTMTVTDPTGFLGLAANGLCYDADGDAAYCEAGEVFTIAGNNATLALAGNSAGFGGNQALIYTSDGTTPMGTSRTLGISGQVDPVVGATRAYTGNAGFWVWGSNGTVLHSPWFSTAAGYISRFVLTNTGPNPVTYQTTCYAETGNTPTAGAAATGTIPATGQLVVNATDVCTFSGNTRGAIDFTIAAPNNVVQGAYNIVNATTGSISVSNMMRPGTN